MTDEEAPGPTGGDDEDADDGRAHDVREADGADLDREGLDRWDDLDRAREALLAADERASGTIHEQLESLEAGVFEEEAGEHTREGPGPKVDRVAEVAEKLDALAGQVDEHEVRERIEAARDHLRRYMKSHPQGG